MNPSKQIILLVAIVACATAQYNGPNDAYFYGIDERPLIGKLTRALIADNDIANTIRNVPFQVLNIPNGLVSEVKPVITSLQTQIQTAQTAAGKLEQALLNSKQFDLAENAILTQGALESVANTVTTLQSQVNGLSTKNQLIEILKTVTTLENEVGIIQVVLNRLISDATTMGQQDIANQAKTIFGYVDSISNLLQFINKKVLTAGLGGTAGRQLTGLAASLTNSRILQNLERFFKALSSDDGVTLGTGDINTAGGLLNKLLNIVSGSVSVNSNGGVGGNPAVGEITNTVTDAVGSLPGQLNSVVDFVTNPAGVTLDLLAETGPEAGFFG